MVGDESLGKGGEVPVDDENGDVPVGKGAVPEEDGVYERGPLGALNGGAAEDAGEVPVGTGKLPEDGRLPVARGGAVPVEYGGT